jgi:hypothetical protein
MGYTQDSQNQIQLHGFADASIRAYGAVLYLRIEHPLSETSMSLITSKTKVVPIKPITIPRLELNSALLLSKLIHNTIQDLKIPNIKIFAWTDSTITLQWIRGHPQKWKTYVANRVSEIHELISPECWSYIPTDQNPADVTSRGSTISDLIENELWWKGPTWLRKNQEEWPKFQVNINHEKVELEAKSIKTFAVNIQSDSQFDLFTRFSSFTKLVNIVAVILRFYKTCKREDKISGPIALEEKVKAKILYYANYKKMNFMTNTIVY